ncbi:zinc finger odd-paired-like (opl) [Fusarium subglutinans]|uniref:Zinc finger odd-paired-like (Opl) n=1 Tax=Gibberella subglutinans TaxID=42677 RepID=A0A8H5NQP9_GIBSU|nr:zinc finger odd-paired-like (opl) [Fusarium subglutinans]KAF5575272.1 zinc finger odd-paired-like (opl) [Fusarium subglutinans]
MDSFATQEECELISPDLMDLYLANLEHLQLSNPPQPSEINITSHHVDPSDQFYLSFDMSQPLANVPFHPPHGSNMQHSGDQNTGRCLDPIRCGSDQEFDITPYLDFSFGTGAVPHLSAHSPGLSFGADLTDDRHPPLQHQTTCQPPATYDWVELNLDGTQPTSSVTTEDVRLQDSPPTICQLLNHVRNLDDSNLLDLKALIDQRVSGNNKTEPHNVLQDQNVLSNLEDSRADPLSSQSPSQSDDGPTHNPQSNRLPGTRVQYEMMRYPCGFPACKKTFKRKEHAKRHYKTCHGGETKLYTCEFCGKNTFARRDNLNAHRKLHSRKRRMISNGVHYIPAAADMFNILDMEGFDKAPASYDGFPSSFETISQFQELNEYQCKSMPRDATTVDNERSSDSSVTAKSQEAEEQPIRRSQSGKVKEERSVARKTVNEELASPCRSAEQAKPIPKSQKELACMESRASSSSPKAPISEISRRTGNFDTALDAREHILLRAGIGLGMMAKDSPDDSAREKSKHSSGIQQNADKALGGRVSPEPELPMPFDTTWKISSSKTMELLDLSHTVKGTYLTNSEKGLWERQLPDPRHPKGVSGSLPSLDLRPPMGPVHLSQVAEFRHDERLRK